jgi:hypothetical protein
MFESLHKRLLRRWWRRLLWGQPSLALEVHCQMDDSPGEGMGSRRNVPRVWLEIACPAGGQAMVEAALRSAYPNSSLRRSPTQLGGPLAVVRLKKQSEFIRRVKVLDRFEHEREPAMSRLMTAMAAAGGSAFLQLALTPAPMVFERYAKHLYRRHEARLAHRRRDGERVVRDRSLVDERELRGGLEVQHRPLLFADVRVVADRREVCERIASELRGPGAENRLVERGTGLRHGLLGIYARRVRRGEGNPWPSWRRGTFATTELAALWHLPGVDYLTVPFARAAVPAASAAPAILRPGSGSRAGAGTLVDALGPVTLHESMRRQNTAVPGTVEQGKTSYLVATVAEDLQRESCAVIVLDPKGDAAEAALSLVPAERTCTLLDFAHPTCGFNPLAVQAPADTIADYVVGALKGLFTDADIRASSDRYLRNALIAVLAYDRNATLWDAARLLSVGEEGYAYRSRVGARIRELPEFKEISEFFTAELAAQLADARSMTTAKLDAPVNKLARLLNSPSIKRVLLNDSLRVDFDRLIAAREVLVVRGALGAMGAGNTSVLMQLLVGMLDAALARQQDLVAPEERVAVALKVDEAPLVLNRNFAETMALKRSAGLETVACWQTDAQWVEREVREQLDALFAQRVYFATASVADARASASLAMAEFSDVVRPGESLSALGNPDARLRLPKHHAIVSWSTPEGRQPPFVARTLPLRVDRERLALHAARQAQRGGRHLADLVQPHWDREEEGAAQGETVAAATATVYREPIAPAGVAAESYRELADLDGAHSARWANALEPPLVGEPDQLDIEILALVASLRHVLSSQIHRRYNPQRASTTTQRRLKRLADAGWVERLQFHRRDGGGTPMCYAIGAAGTELLRVHGRLEEPREDCAVTPREGGLRQARHDVHVAGWALALERSLGGARLRLRGPAESVLSPPLRSGPEGRMGLGPGDLRLPGGRTAHGFLGSDEHGRRREVERFATVRPDAVVEVPASEREAPVVDVLVELDDRLPRGSGAAKLERYDHLLSGWSVCTKRYGRRPVAVPLAVFVCRDRARARECARAADHVLTACRAYAGEYPADWEYPGRARVLFAAERDVHEGLLLAYGVPRLPPDVRVAVAHGDPTAREPLVQVRSLLAGQRALAGAGERED